MMNYSFELNNARNDSVMASGKVSEKSPVVEIFSAMVEGKELSGFGKKADVAVNYIKGLGEKASAGDLGAISELNEIRKFVVQPKLLQEIKLLGLFGSYKHLGWNDTAHLEKYEYENVDAKIQAEGLDVSTPFTRKTKTPLAPVTISAGHKVNYRELALGDMTNENTLMKQVRIDIRNKAILYAIETIFNAIDNAAGVKYFYEASGLAQTGVDGLLAKIRRYGKPNVFGTYALLSEFLPWIGYAGTVGSTSVTGVSQKIMDEINDTGIVGSYKGSVLKEIPNPYNYTKIETKDGVKNYAPYLPDGVAFVTPAAPSNGIAPIQTFSIGRLTSFSGNDVASGDVLTRFDLKVAAGVASTEGVAIIHDSQLDNF